MEIIDFLNFGKMGDCIEIFWVLRLSVSNSCSAADCQLVLSVEGFIFVLLDRTDSEDINQLFL